MFLCFGAFLGFQGNASPLIFVLHFLRQLKRANAYSIRQTWIRLKDACHRWTLHGGASHVVSLIYFVGYFLELHQLTISIR
jgi:hypothetical protein